MGGTAASLAGGWVLAAVVSLASGCGSDTSPGELIAVDDPSGDGSGDGASDPQPSRPDEPGDPVLTDDPQPTESPRPALDTAMLTLQQWPEGVRLIGNAGAVLPGGGAVTIMNAETGELATASVAPDGSLGLFAPGDRNTDLLVDVDGDGVPDGRIPSLVDAAFALDGECNCGTTFVSYIEAGRDWMWGTPAMPLGCYCGSDCSFADSVQALNLDDYAATSCAEPDARALRVSGCGLTSVYSDAGSYGGTKYTFDDATGLLRGVMRYSDTPYGKCASGDGAGWFADNYIYGDYLASPAGANELTVPCASATTCRLCGSPPGDDIPACD